MPGIYTNQILGWFQRLCALPRPSGGEQTVVAAIRRWLTAAGLEVETDSVHNLRCILPPTSGCASQPGIILQAHTDMVCVASPGGGWRPGLDPVTPVSDGKWLKSDGRSTLGADNGIGVALMLWLALESGIDHGPVALLFTACEERGLTGAKALSSQWLEGFQYYINLDSFRSDAAIIASAGGLRRSWWYEPAYCAPPDGAAFRLTLSRLTGGHSGSDINLGRLNALVELALFLRAQPVRIADFSGGSDYNAIPSTASAIILAQNGDTLRQAAGTWAQELHRAHSDAEPSLTVTLQPWTRPERIWDTRTADDILSLLLGLPCGVTAMRADRPDCVADSGNPAALGTEEGKVILRHFMRCADRASMEHFRQAGDHTAKRLHFTPGECSSYPPWNGATDNPFAQFVAETYHTITGSPMELRPVHVGLESSLILDKAPQLSGVSIGCRILDAHAVTERVELSTVETLAQLVCAILSKKKGETL